ncbi:hypothetical protein B0H13DRAFT_1855056 [Mycena leptocephala]|nr:hypothetical protein B0H13DRAFT_1855056 [Mycena leptocephala]
MPEGLDAPKDREFAGTESVAELAPDGGPPDNPLKAEDVPGSDMTKMRLLMICCRKLEKLMVESSSNLGLNQSRFLPATGIPVGSYRWILDLEGEDRRVGELSLGVFNDVGP